MSAHTLARDLEQMAEFHGPGDPGSAGTIDVQPGMSGVNVACESGGAAEERYLPDVTNLPVGIRFTVTNNSSTSLVIKTESGGSTLATLDNGAQAVEFLLSQNSGTKTWLSSALFSTSEAT